MLTIARTANRPDAGSLPARAKSPNVTLVMIGVAGVLGVLARYGLGQLTPSIWATFAVNVAGSLLLGILIHVGRDLEPAIRDALSVGFLGGFTTFSTFTMQAVLQADDGRLGTAVLYVTASVVCGTAAAAAGYYGTKAL